jgi:hypothetical protein
MYKNLFKFPLRFFLFLFKKIKLKNILIEKKRKNYI